MKYVSDSNLSRFFQKLKGIFAKKSEVPSQADLDARYLQLSGGTLTGAINLDINATSTAIKYGGSAIAMSCFGGGVQLGNVASYLTLATASSRDVTHLKGTTYYNVLDASNTAANPTLAGTETALTSLKLNGTSYKVGGGSLYQHYIQINDSTRQISIYTSVITASATPFTYSSFTDYLITNGIIMGDGYGLTQNNHIIPATGFANVSGNQTIFGITGINANPAEIGAVPYQNSYTQNISYSTDGATLFDNVIQIA